MSKELMTQIVREHWVENWEHPTYPTAVRCMAEGCQWEGRFPGDIAGHVADVLTSAGFSKLPEPGIEWGTRTKWGARPSTSKKNALDYIQLCHECGDSATLIKRRAAIAPGPWEDAE
jgi:hypothetical protein